MREYQGSEIRNIAVVGHGGSGKTSLVDALAFVSGSSKRHGTVGDGTSLTDTAPEEIERGYSINLGCAFAEWMDTKINLLDTPGFLDFQGDAIAGLAAADGALCVVGATAGVEVGTERMFREAVLRGDPVLFVVPMMDKEHADFDGIYQQIKTRLSNKVIPIEVPVGQGADFHGIVNLFDRRAHVYTRAVKTGAYEETDVPAEVQGQFDKYYNELIETVAATDDNLLERYLNGDELYNATRDGAEKLNHLAVSQGKDRIEVQRLRAGDIGCVAKLRNTHTNDTLSTRAHPVRLPQIVFPDPLVQMAIHPVNRADEEKVQQGLHRLHDEDPAFETQWNAETHETLVSGLGERHLEVALSKLKRKFGVQAELSKPKIAYRETIRARAEGQGRHKKQSGGRGQFGDCWVRFAPTQRGDGIRFEDRIVGGSIPSQFIPAVATGIQAFKAVAPKCRPVLLEPLDEVEITTPDASLGDVLGDLSSRRGQILGTDVLADVAGTRVRALVPQSELHLYASALQSMTHGRATFRRHFRGYEEMPSDAAQRVVEESQKTHTAEAAH